MNGPIGERIAARVDPQPRVDLTKCLYCGKSTAECKGQREWRALLREARRSFQEVSLLPY